ncbi:aspartate/glutamate/uridylate kinase, partial [Tanacetum coccineum]
MPLNSDAIAILVPNTILLTWHHFFSMAREVWHDRSPIRHSLCSYSYTTSSKNTSQSSIITKELWRYKKIKSCSISKGTCCGGGGGKFRPYVAPCAMMIHTSKNVNIQRYAPATSSPSCQITIEKQKPVTNARWRRVVFNISGASLAGTGARNVDPK